MAGKHVLVVEDDPDLRTELMRILEQVGYRTASVENGAAALTYIRGGNPRPDLIVLDLQMPVLSGWEFLTIRESDPVLLMIPVLVASGQETAPAEMEHDAFLRKPIDPERLQAAVERIIDESNPDPERTPRRTEPWSLDEKRPTHIRNALGRVVAVLATEREARRVVAAVNGVSQISTAALEQGIIDKGLHCLYDMHRYDTDKDYREELDAGDGLASILKRRDEVANVLRFYDGKSAGRSRR